jgi:NAD(P)-dependent dehydrogenase (short-subunit alcohol dehydrogenase family)
VIRIDHSGRNVVITGVGGNVGKAVARSFVESGASVVGIDRKDRSNERLAGIRDEIDYYQCDLVDESEVKRTARRITGEYEAVHHLSNIVGGWIGGKEIHETDLETYETVMNINLKTAFLMSKHLIPEIRAANGSIVSISGRTSRAGGPKDGLYRASKAGVTRVTESIAEENKGDMRANTILPSVINTPENRRLRPDEDHSRWVEPEQIANLILFLASDLAVDITGATIPIYAEA